ncbi:MAG: methyltransferase domain-containing protein [Bryobacteraceae bacterium]
MRVTFPDRSRRRLLVVSGTPTFEDGGLQEQSVSVVRLCSSMLLSLALETDTLKPESLDGAVLFLALETFAQPHLALAALHSLLRPQAKLFIEFADASRWRALMMGGYWPGIHLPEQRFCYRAAHVRKILAKSGFRVDRAANGASPSDFLSPVAAGGGGWLQTAARMLAWGSCTLMQTTRCAIGFSESN